MNKERGGYKTEHPGAQENYDKFDNIYDELLQLEKDIKSMDKKLVVLFGVKKKAYDLDRCYKQVGRIFKNVGDDAVCNMGVNGMYLMTQDEKFQLFG
jgi:hypothetical protein